MNIVLNIMEDLPNNPCRILAKTGQMTKKFDLERKKLAISRLLCYHIEHAQWIA